MTFKLSAVSMALLSVVTVSSTTYAQETANKAKKKETSSPSVHDYNPEVWKKRASVGRTIGNYKQKMEVTGNDLELMRYHEALMNLGIAFEGWDNKKRKNKFYMGDAIKIAVEKNLVREFLDYELEYLENPKAALYLTYDEVKTLSKYILEVRALQESSRKEIIEDNTKLIDGK